MEWDKPQFAVLTHDLDKPHNWWADGPFDTKEAAEIHKSKLRTGALDHTVIVLTSPRNRMNMEGQTTEGKRPSDADYKREQNP